MPVCVGQSRRKVSQTDFLPVRSSEKERRTDVLNQCKHYGRNAEKTGMDRKAFWSLEEGELDSAPGTRRRFLGGGGI